MMKNIPSFLCLIFALPAVVLARVPYSSIDDETGISIADAREIEVLVALTKKIEESGGNLPWNSNPPQITEEDVSFYVYNKKDLTPTEVKFSEAAKITEISVFDINLPTVFIIHGWHGAYGSSFPTKLGHAYLKGIDANIISVNWDELAASFYIKAYDSAKPVGQYVGQFIKGISAAYDYSLNKVSIVGHSLGAQITGFVGKETEGKLHSITGLDPAGPLFLEKNPDERLNQGDAQYVQVIHTNAGFLGVNYDVGDADYWPNGGMSQPGCGIDVTGFCAHSRSHMYFTEALNSVEFIAKFCDSYSYYIDGQCKTNQAAVMGGVSVNATIDGTYYLETNAESPFALGDIGL
ncbi:phospholipase A1 2-like [Euwallacea fornicatus]|uniref:phospholipase A1 2-like n=1 Tax=Euwallacea fornicatus TaxID=995702 RepID=UPI00338F8C13